MKLPKRSTIVEGIKSINVEPVVFLMIVGDGLLGLPEYNLMLKKTCLSGSSLFGQTKYPPNICSNLSDYPDQQAEVQKIVSKFNSVSDVVASIMIMLVTIFFGSWCDQGGKKGLIILSCLGRFASVASLLINFVCKDLVVEYFWLEFPNYLCGDNSSLLLGAYAIVADRSSPNTRTLRILVLNGIQRIGSALGNLVAGYILEYGTFLASLGVYVVLLIGALLYSVFVLQSGQQQAKKSSLRDVYSLKYFQSLFSFIVRRRDNGMRHIILLLIFTACLSDFSWGCFTVDYLYITRKFSWPEISDNPTYPVTWYSQLKTIIDIPQILAVFFIIPFLTNILHIHDLILAALAHLCFIAGVLNFAFAANRNLLYLNAVLWIFAPNQTPAIRAILSKIVDPDEVGKVDHSMEDRRCDHTGVRSQ